MQIPLVYWFKSNQVTLNYLKTGATLLLLGIMILFAVGATHTLVKIRDHNSLLEQRAYDVPWSLMQLQLEMGRFIDAVRLRHYGAVTHDELMLRYDILWSRTPVLLSGKLTEVLDRRPDLLQLVQQIENRVQGLEPQVVKLLPNSSDYQTILIELIPYFEPLSQTVTATMQNNVRFYNEYDQAYRALSQRLNIQVASLFVSVILLLLLLLREHLRHQQQQLKDPLTQLANRAAAQRRLNLLIGRAVPFSVTLIKIRQFGDINRKFGFEFGDELLQAVACRVSESLSANEYLARLERDEFLLVAEGLVELEEVRAQVSRIREAIGRRQSIMEHDFYLQPMIGVALYPSDAGTAVELVSHAEIALDLCRRQQAPYVFFDPSLLKEITRTRQLATDLIVAMENHSLTLSYQPVIELGSGRCTGLEALCHWHHPEFGVITQPELLRVAEQFQLSERLVNWVLRLSCRYLCNWHQQGYRQLTLVLKIPPSVFRQELLAAIRDELKQAGLKPQDLVLEVTEETLAQDIPGTMVLMDTFARHGIRLILDGFGSGLSSLGQLSRAPFDWLKIDTGFMSGIEHPGPARHQLGNLIAIGQVLNLPLICDGVVSEHQRQVLGELSRELMIQGELVTRPLPALEVQAWLKKHGTAPGGGLRAATPA
ncbi:putative bifunctional diguanylate cyclase/phosphodiesterase [Zobellella maritima]|uniref:putative bifunctional diguanylate cyclase/phosphodiesterase n=1 Tax=Zobellella maritima TaxID=2059725 RepID=UPI000E3063C6|nr:EAL domain-containing protein [Zobellella maritima]